MSNPLECFSFTSEVIQWNPSCEATPFVPEKWPFKRSGLSSVVDINTLCLDLHCQVAVLERMASCQGGLSKGVPLNSTR